MMFSNSIRDYSISNYNRIPSIIYRRETKLAVVNISNVEAKVEEEILPYEWSILKLTEMLGQVSRVEIHVVTGLSLDLIDHSIAALLNTELICLSEPDMELFHKNIDKLEKDFGDLWKTPQIIRLVNRPVIIQYSLTDAGRHALSRNKKSIDTVRDLHMIVSTSPFSIFFDQAQMKQVALQEIEIPQDSLSKIIELSKQEGERLENKIIPKDLGGDSIVDSYEVNRAHIWITVNVSDDRSFDSCTNYDLYITSAAFTRWSNPPVSKDLSELMGLEGTFRTQLVETISDTFDMVIEVVDENLELTKDLLHWQLGCDLEMLLLIREHERDPIEKTVSEVFFTSEAGWDMGILLQLVPKDDLAKISLFAARFHSRVDRSGFTEEEGYATWSGIFVETELESSYEEYKNAIRLLLDAGALKIEKPKVTAVVVDLDNMLGRNQRRNDFWKMNRVRIMHKYLLNLGIEKIYYYATERVDEKIDGFDEWKSWSEENGVDYYEEEDEVPPPMRFAADNQFHYLGAPVPRVQDDDLIRQMRIAKRGLAFHFQKDKISIKQLEPVYNWFPLNIIEYQYNKHYE